MKVKEAIGLIGTGTMGTAILESLLEKKLVSRKQVWIYDKIEEKAEEFSKKSGFYRAGSNEDLVYHSDIILLAIKPQDLNSAGQELKNKFQNSQVLISILAGTPIAKIKQAFGTQPKIVRAMPNLGAKVGQSVTALAGEDENALHSAEMIFQGCGRIVPLRESYFDLVTAISGSGPAYFFFLMELLAKEVASHGLGPEEAKLLAVQTAVGAGLLAQASPVSPEELRKMVTSKGGTTEAALKVLESNRFREIFHEALEAAINRSRELSQM